MICGIAFGVCLSLQPVFGHSTSKVKWLGKGKFGVGMGTDITLNASEKNGKFAATVKPYVKGKLFGKQFTLIDVNGKFGNYDSTKWDAKEKAQRFDGDKFNRVKYDLAIRPFGVTVKFGVKKLKPRKGSMQESVVLHDWSVYRRKPLFKIPIPAGPVTIWITGGVFGRMEYKPTLSMYGLAAMSLTSAPRASMGAYAEGSVSAILIQAGIGVELTLIEGYAGLMLAVQPFPGVAGLYLIGGVEALKGKVYVFVDRIGVTCCFKKKWKRALNFTILKQSAFIWLDKLSDKQKKKREEARAKGQKPPDPGIEFFQSTRDENKFLINWDPKDVKRMDVLEFKPAITIRYQHAIAQYRLYDYNKLVDSIKKAL